MKKIIGLAIAAFACAIACNNSPNQVMSGPETDTLNRGGTDIEYRLAKNYFVRNDADLSGFSSPKIETQDAFDAIFGPATIMGDEGTPTPVDFKKKYVVAIINPLTERDVTLEVEQVQKSGDLITVTYTETSGGKQTMQTRPFLLLILNREDDSRVEVVKHESNLINQPSP